MWYNYSRPSPKRIIPPLSGKKNSESTITCFRSRVSNSGALFPGGIKKYAQSWTENGDRRRGEGKRDLRRCGGGGRRMEGDGSGMLLREEVDAAEKTGQ